MGVPCSPKLQLVDDIDASQVRDRTTQLACKPRHPSGLQRHPMATEKDAKVHQHQAEAVLFAAASRATHAVYAYDAVSQAKECAGDGRAEEIHRELLART